MRRGVTALGHTAWSDSQPWPAAIGSFEVRILSRRQPGATTSTSILTRPAQMHWTWVLHRLSSMTRSGVILTRPMRAVSPSRASATPVVGAWFESARVAQPPLATSAKASAEAVARLNRRRCRGRPGRP